MLESEHSLSDWKQVWNAGMLFKIYLTLVCLSSCEFQLFTELSRSIVIKYRKYTTISKRKGKKLAKVQKSNILFILFFSPIFQLHPLSLMDISVVTSWIHFKTESVTTVPLHYTSLVESLFLFHEQKTQRSLDLIHIDRMRERLWKWERGEGDRGGLNT